MTYTGTSSKVSGQGGVITSITSGAGTTIVTIDVHDTKTGVYDITIRATDTGTPGLWVEDTFILTIS